MVPGNTTSIHFVLHFLVTVVSYLYVSQATAAQPTENKPNLLVLQIGRTDSAQRRERAFVSELQLSLDNYLVITDSRFAQSDAVDFSKMPLQEQLFHVRKQAWSYHAVAVIWLIESNNAEATFLQLTALSSGRTLIRIVEAKNDPNTEVTLAMVVDELMGQAYLFNSQNPADALEASVLSTSNPEMTQKNKESKTDPKKSFRNERMHFFLIEGIARTGMAAVQGPRFSFGGSLGIGRTIFNQMDVGSGLNLIAGPFKTTSDVRIENRSLEPYVSVGIIRPLKRISFRLGLHISLPRQQTIVTFPETGTHVYNAWNMRYALRFTLSVPLGHTVALAFSPEFGVWLNQKRYFALSTDRDITKNARLDGGLTVSVIVK